jgi:hypothetical protein
MVASYEDTTILGHKISKSSRFNTNLGHHGFRLFTIIPKNEYAISASYKAHAVKTKREL